MATIEVPRRLLDCSIEAQSLWLHLRDGRTPPSVVDRQWVYDELEKHRLVRPVDLRVGYEVVG